MSEQHTTTQDERLWASLSHASILLAVVTGGLGGIGAALVIWVAQRGKSAYVAAQALQAAVYQVITFIVTMVAWACWGISWMGLLLPPLILNPGAYEHTPPAGLWVGLILAAVPLLIQAAVVLYALWGAARCIGGHQFRYALIGRWLGSQECC
jgi:uncharacterized Tic20 family protein